MNELCMYKDEKEREREAKARVNMCAKQSDSIFDVQFKTI